MTYSDELGKIVYSRAGRDAKKYFIVIGIINENYVLVCDGQLRPVEKPKKKKIKHLIFTNKIAHEIKDAILIGNKVNNNQIKNILQSVYTSKEV